MCSDDEAEVQVLKLHFPRRTGFPGRLGATIAGQQLRKSLDRVPRWNTIFLALRRPEKAILRWHLCNFKKCKRGTNGDSGQHRCWSLCRRRGAKRLSITSADRSFGTFYSTAHRSRDFVQVEASVARPSLALRVGTRSLAWYAFPCLHFGFVRNPSLALRVSACKSCAAGVPTGFVPCPRSSRPGRSRCG